jgi:hypothetical protein
MTRLRSSQRARFSVRVEPRRKMTVRSIEPHDPGSRRGTTAASSPVSIAVVRQRGTLTAIPPIAAPGPDPTVPTAAAQVLASFTPPAPGSPVLLQKKTTFGWRTVAVGEQNLSGSVAFGARPGVTYRAAASPTSTTAPVLARAFTEKFADDFTTPGPDGRSPDPARWSDQARVDVPDRTCSTNSPTARDVAGGVLHLRVTTDPSRPGPCTYSHDGQTRTAPHLLNTQVGTPKTFTFTHGYAAARMKMHASPGAHAAFWMLPSKTVPDDQPDWHDVGYTPGDPSKGAEIDVVEYWANPTRSGSEPRIGSFLHWYEADGTHASLGAMAPHAARLRPDGHTWDDAFHVFAVRWSPTEYEFLVDGQVYARETRAVSQGPQYLVLSMLASNYELDRLTPALLNDSAEVDWVRVWSL